VGRLAHKGKDGRDRYELIKRKEAEPVDPRTGTPGGLHPKDAPVPILPAMREWIMMDQELLGDLDDSGCYASLPAVLALLDEMGIDDPEDRADARRLLRELGVGRAEATMED
jgi:hypothetical protein